MRRLFLLFSVYVLMRPCFGVRILLVQIIKTKKGGKFIPSQNALCSESSDQCREEEDRRGAAKPRRPEKEKEPVKAAVGCRV